MLGTYGSFAAVLLASGGVRQAVFCLCGRREWSWLAPAVGLAGLTAVAWGTVRLPGDGAAAAIAIAALVLVAVGVVWRRTPGAGSALVDGAPALIAALVLA